LRGLIERRNATRRETSALRRWVTALGLALIALIVGVDAYEAWQDYRRVVSDNEHIMLALGRALTEQTERLVQEADVVLADYAGWVTSAEGRSADRQAMIARLAEQVVSLPFVSYAQLIGPDGELLATTKADAEADRTLKYLPAFTVPARTPGNALYVDRPRTIGHSSLQTFALSRRVTTPSGEFAGVVVARVAFEYLATFYAEVNVTPDTFIRLARGDGVTLVEYPPNANSIEPNPGEQSGPTAAPAKQRMEYAVANGRKMIRVSQQVSKYPIFVTVSRSLASVMRPWIEEERSSAVRTLTLAAFAAVLLTALRSALRRQEHIDRERHRLERELSGVRQVEALGFLAAAVAHDFNNVLTAIIGYAELQRDMVEPEPLLLANMDRLLAATERARLLVRRVLTFDPRRSVRYQPTEIESITIEVVQQVQATLPDSIRINVRALQATTVLGDATEIYQVLMNLCSNAVQAMPAGGILTISLEPYEVDAPRDLALGRLEPGRWVAVSIVDSGIGLAEEQVMSIFEPFYTTRQSTHGTGIGLTVVRNIILRMHGALSVDSRRGLGTRMTVYWPQVPAPTPPGLPWLEEAGAGQTILVVDDEKELVVLTEELLASLSYEPVGFSDARAAIEAFRSDPRRFDAILTDERMQSMRGLDFAKVIHELDPSVPIILMTGHRDAQIDAHAKEAGIVEILDKPLRVQMLRQALARQLNAARP
jgi:signal transduction histidine kinase/ActR/RegA family two-component response regulator